MIKKAHSSLAWRVLTIALLLLVVPLLLQTYILYRQEYKQKLRDVSEILTVVLQERALLIEEQIKGKWALLDVAQPDVKQLYIEKFIARRDLSPYFVLSSRKREAFLVGKKSADGSVLVTPLPFSGLTQMDAPYPVRLALIDAENRVLSENIPVRASAPDLLQVEQPLPLTEKGIQLELTIPKELIRDLHLRNYYFRFATLLLFVGVFGGFAVFLLTRRVSKPLRSLCNTMDQVSQGALHARYTPDRMGFEINQLGKQFNQTLDAMQQQMQEAEKERIARQKLAEELRIGRSIQTALFPHRLSQIPGLEIASRFIPAKELHGDYYDLFSLENGSLLIAMADSAGKGIPACLYSLGLRSIIRSLATTTIDLSALVIKANELFWLDAHTDSMFATLWLGIYDPSKRMLTYCSQGHPPALLLRKQRMEPLGTNGLAMGAQKLEAVTTAQIALQPSDLLLLYTDGIVEAHNAEQALFGQKRLEEFLLRTTADSSEKIIDELLREIDLFTQGAPQHDDMTLLSLRTLF